MWGDFGGHSGWMGLGLLFWILVIAAFVIALRGHRCGRRRKVALDILKERYARGEISDEEFQHKRKELE